MSNENMNGENMNDENISKCFVIMPISDQLGYSTGHFTKIYEQIFIPAIEDAGYKPDRVDEDNICDSIIFKIFERIQNCDMALCDLSSRNPNVLYELGLRQAYDKPVVLVQDEKTERIFDVSGISTIPYNSDRLYESVLAARENITRALIETRDGKTHSLVKIVKASEASFPEENLSGNEKTEIMLERIMAELTQLKQVRRLKNDELVYPDNKIDNIVLSVLRLDSEVEEALKNKSSQAVFKRLTLIILKYRRKVEELDMNPDVRLKLINTLDSYLDQIKVYKEKHFDI